MVYLTQWNLIFYWRQESFCTMYKKIVVPSLVALKKSDKVCWSGSNFALRKQGVGSIFLNNLNTINHAVAQCTHKWKGKCGRGFSTIIEFLEKCVKCPSQLQNTFRGGKGKYFSNFVNVT